MFYFTTFSVHFIYGYTASDIIWLKTTERKPATAITWANLSGYQQRIFYMYLQQPFCYTSRGVLVGMTNSSLGPPSRIDP